MLCIIRKHPHVRSALLFARFSCLSSTQGSHNWFPEQPLHNSQGPHSQPTPRVDFLKSDGEPVYLCLDLRVCKCTHKWDVLGDLLSHEIQIEIKTKYYYLKHELWIEIKIQIIDDSTNQGCVGWSIFQQGCKSAGRIFLQDVAVMKRTLGVPNLKPWNLQSSLPRCAKTGSPPDFLGSPIGSGSGFREPDYAAGTWLRCAPWVWSISTGQGGAFCWPGLVEPVWLWEKGQRAVWAGAAHFPGASIPATNTDSESRLCMIRAGAHNTAVRSGLLCLRMKWHPVKYTNVMTF